MKNEKDKDLVYDKHIYKALQIQDKTYNRNVQNKREEKIMSQTNLSTQ